MSKPKRINVEMISEEQTQVYRLLEELRSSFHPQLRDASIGLAWRKSLKPDKDGRLILGRCRKVSDLQKEFSPLDFIIELNWEVWNDPLFDEAKKRALLDHELCHAEIQSDDETGETKHDERGRTLFRTRKHDLEEFREIVDRHGLYKQDLEKFAESILHAKRSRDVGTPVT